MHFTVTFNRALFVRLLLVQLDRVVNISARLSVPSASACNRRFRHSRSERGSRPGRHTASPSHVWNELWVRETPHRLQKYLAATGRPSRPTIIANKLVFCNHMAWFLFYFTLIWNIYEEYKWCRYTIQAKAITISTAI